MNYGATGTIRDNRLPKNFPLQSAKQIKTEVRGTMDVIYDSKNKISVVRWKDNAPVTIASNISTAHSTKKASR